jgi:hypothetical protein
MLFNFNLELAPSLVNGSSMPSPNPPVLGWRSGNNGLRALPANSDRRVSIPLLAFLNSLIDEVPANGGAEVLETPAQK